MRIKSVCIYTGAREDVPEHFKNAAAEVGVLLAQNNYKIVYGGGNTGLMGALSNAAIDHEGNVLGITTKHLADIEKLNTSITESRIVETMHIRKKMMFDHSEVFIILPGGFGTLDEFFEILTWKQLSMHFHPILIYNYQGYWTPLKMLIESLLENGFITENHMELIVFFDHMEDLIPLLKSFDPIP